jgi:hypothetical protein
MFGLLQVGLGLTLFALGSRLLPSGQASLIATLETPLMPFWIWLAFQEVPAFRALAGGADDGSGGRGHHRRYADETRDAMRPPDATQRVAKRCAAEPGPKRD